MTELKNQKLINPDRQEAAKLIEFFEDKGYSGIKEVSTSVNYIFHGFKGKQPVFIKKFNHPIFGNSKTNYQRADTEIQCYQNLPPEFLIKFLEANQDDHYIILKREKLEDIDKNEKEVERMINFGQNIFKKVDASFLPKWTWEDYEQKIFPRLEKLEQAGADFKADNVKKLFTKNKPLLEKCPKGFGHLDFNFLNVKKVNGKLVIFDFENAHQDNAMVDMAILYLEICDNKKLKIKFKEIIEKSNLYNEELLKLMIIRRSAIVMHAGMGENDDLRLEMPFRRKNYNELVRLCNGEPLFEEKI